MNRRIYNLLKRIKNKYFLKYAQPNDSDVNFFSKIVKNNDLVFDVGANQGEITELFLKLGAEVVSVEPQKVFATHLHNRFKNNNKVNIVNKALSSVEGKSEILICDGAPTLSTLSTSWAEEGRFSKNYEWNRKEIIETTTLDNLIQLYGIPKFCKIDVEGFELEVLSGLTKKIPFISIEYVTEFFDKTRECIKKLQDIGEIKITTRNSELGFSIDEFHDPEEVLKALEQKGGLLNGDIYIKFV